MQCPIQSTCVYGPRLTDARAALGANRSSVRSIVIPCDLHARVGGAKPNVTIRVWIQPTEKVMFTATVYGPGSLAKGDRVYSA